MYTDMAYLGRRHEDIVNNNEPLVITAVGNYIVNKSYKISTNRRLGRGDFQILYIAEGKCRFYFDGKEKIVKKGNLIIFRPYQPQRYYLYKKDMPETYWIHFTGYEAEKILDSFNMPKETITYIGTQTDLQWLFRQMIRELREKAPDYDKMLIFQFNQFLLTIKRTLSSQKTSRLQTFEEIERAIHYFDNNFYKDINIEKYTDEHFIKPCWFIKNFKLATGFTPMQYIINLRIKRARTLLEATTYNISQIAQAVGYDNPLYFSRLFSKYMGISPTAYRKTETSKKSGLTAKKR